MRVIDNNHFFIFILIFNYSDQFFYGYLSLLVIEYLFCFILFNAL